MYPTPVAVMQSEQFAEQSEQLAKRLSISLLQPTPINHITDYPYVLLYTVDGLVLQQTGKKADGPVLVDFVKGTNEHRRTMGGGELIVKAVGGDKKNRPKVLDVTAGLGRDSFVLANAGYSVIALERSPIVFELIRDGLQRASVHASDDIQSIVNRMQLKPMDAFDYLSHQARYHPPDVIFIDPMFPESKKSALVKKDMRAFHRVVGGDQDSDELLVAALDVAIHRVVVKRPKKAVFLAGKKPNLSIDGKAIRFDVYTKKRF